MSETHGSLGNRRGSRGKDLPQVSILTTVYNCEAFLSEAIESILRQATTLRWELLVVDDGSTDRSLAVATTFADRFPDCIRVLQHPDGKNRGISASRNLGLRHAQGSLLAFLDADDVWLPHLLETQVRVLEHRQEVAMVYASAERWYDFAETYDPIFGSRGRNSLPPLIPESERPGLVPSPRLLDWFTNDESMTPCTCTVVVRTATARRLGGFVNSFCGLYDDQAFYAKLALEEQVYVRLDCVARYRQHPDSCCAQARRSEDIQQKERKHFDTWLMSYREELKTSHTPLGKIVMKTVEALRT